MDMNRDLTLDEYKKLSELFDNCSYADIDDTQLFETGDHRQLYEYVTGKLGIKCQAGRGPIYHLAAKLLAENRNYRMVFILNTIKMHRPSYYLWAEYLMKNE